MEHHHHSQMDEAGALARFQDSLRMAGVKVTHQRMEIFREVLGSTAHPDVETIFEGVRRRLPSVSLDTVYRTLWLLVDLGLVATLGQPRERMRFDANPLPHHHFICMRCGSAQDFLSSEFDGLSVPESVRSFGRIERAHVELRGVCNACAEAAEN